MAETAHDINSLDGESATATAVPAVLSLPTSIDAGRVLVVEDDPVQRHLVRRITEQAGFAVDCAANPREAGRLLADNSYVSVVLDLSLGEQDGVSLLHLIARARHPPKLVLMSGFDDRIRLAVSRLANGLGIPVAGTLRKPISADSLRALLNAKVAARRWHADAEPGRRLTAVHLAAALERREIRLEFQPKISMATGKAVGTEALARWFSPTLGEISPARFIPALERAGLIREMTEQGLATALSACAQWRRAQPAMSVAVNISPLLLTDRDFPDRIETMVADAGLPPAALVLEITESDTIGNDLVAAEILNRLRIKGIGLSIDDFGTGYSSLLSLMQMPFGELKIDQSFASRCDTDTDAWKIVRASLLLGHEFGMTVTAEGIESEAVAARLRDAGCDTVQGWLYGCAMPLATLDEWLSRQ